jgi:hypothetical protein
MPTKEKKRLKDGGAIIHVSPRTAAVAFDGATLDDWSDEELLRGRRMNKNGKFTGRPPKFVPIEFHRELTRRRLQRATTILAYSLVDAATMLRSVVNDDQALTTDRIKAAEIMFDRILGKPRESVALDIAPGGQESPWQRAIAQAVVGTDHEVIEVEPVETRDPVESAETRPRHARVRRAP